MAAAETKLWWYNALHRLVLRSLAQASVPYNAHILDAGCGTGGLLQKLQKKGYDQLQGIDLSSDAVEYCNQKGFSVVQDDVSQVCRHFQPGSFDVVISNDVLCYFKGEEQLTVFSDLFSLLKENGFLIMNLPALKAFSGIHDLSVGLVHRFGPADLQQMIAPADVKLVRKRYWPFFLSPLIYQVRAIQRRKLRNDPQVKIESDVSVPPAPVNQLLYGLTRLELAIPPIYPFASSLFVVFQKVKV